MNESYAEFLVKRKTPVYAPILTGLLGLLTAVMILAALSGNVIAIIGMFVMGFLTYLSFRNARVEFEYLFVTGIFSVDKVLGQAKRKKTFECTIDDIQLVAPTGSDHLNEYKVQNEKVLDCSSKAEHAKTYTMIVRSGAESTRLIFEPNDKMLQCLYQAAPRKVKRQ